MLRTVLIDDEAHMRQTLENLVKQYCPEVLLLAKADGVETGVAAIRKYYPDLVLLDIKLDDGTAFDLLKRLEPIDFKIIFITAYDDYAIRAFRLSAIDYLLKPVDPEELLDAVKKAGKTLQENFNIQLNSLNEHLQSQDTAVRKLIVKTSESIHLLPVNDILYCESDGGYTTLFLRDQQSIISSTTLREYEDLLTESGFFRVHKSYLINMKYINRFEKTDGGVVVLMGEYRIPVASRKKDLLLELFERLAGNMSQ